MPEVSVIVPNYNHASFLRERIDSILHQSFRDFELILLDDASSDDSRDILETYRHHSNTSHVIVNTTNSGLPFSQWKKGIELATGKWVWIAESDDIAAPAFLEQMLKAIKSCGEPVLCYCDSYIKTKESIGEQMPRYAKLKNEEFQTNKWNHPYCAEGSIELNETLKWACTINNASAVLFNRDQLLSIVPLIGQFKYHGDWLLYLHLLGKGGVAYNPATLNIYRNHDSNHSKSEGFNKLSKIEHFRILEYLMNNDAVSDKKKLLAHFTNRYIGFGLIKEKGLGKNGLYREYQAINPDLAKQVLAKLMLQKLTGK